MKHRPKIAIVSLTSCEGCQFAILDLGKEFIKLSDQVDLGEFRLVEEMPEDKNAVYDIAFVEGSPVTLDNKRYLKQIRRQAKKLVVLGNCAALGGVPEIKNYQGPIKAFFSVYKKSKRSRPAVINEITNLVKVDYIIAGCPINAQEFYRVTKELLAGQQPEPYKLPVCVECQTRGYDCFLKKGQFCLGPITMAGCEAICVKSRMHCQGCRGLVPDKNIFAFVVMMEKRHGKERLKREMEMFGLRDEVEAKVKKEMKI